MFVSNKSEAVIIFTCLHYNSVWPFFTHISYKDIQVDVFERTNSVAVAETSALAFS